MGARLPHNPWEDTCVARVGSAGRACTGVAPEAPGSMQPPGHTRSRPVAKACAIGSPAPPRRTASRHVHLPHLAKSSAPAQSSASRPPHRADSVQRHQVARYPSPRPAPNATHSCRVRRPGQPSALRATPAGYTPAACHHGRPGTCRAPSHHATGSSGALPYTPMPRPCPSTAHEVVARPQACYHGARTRASSLRSTRERMKRSKRRKVAARRRKESEEDSVLLGRFWPINSLARE